MVGTGGRCRWVVHDYQYICRDSERDREKMEGPYLITESVNQ